MEAAEDDIDDPWISAEDGWIEGDIIRWHEPVFLGKGKNAFRKIGSRTVTAQVQEGRGGYVDLVTLRCEETSRTQPRRATTTLVIATDTEIRRKRETILDGRPERLLWRDESVRAILTDGETPSITDPCECGMTSTDWN